MLFSSFTFLFNFLPATALAVAAARLHSPRAGILVLAVASLVFYGAWKPVYLVLFLGSVAANFALGLAMTDPARRRVVGIAGVTLNLALLGFFKYVRFALDSVGAPADMTLPLAHLVLPLGISFFTFQQIAYLVDIMRGAKVERDIVSYVLFVSFFPHLIAGPLVHHAEMIPQFRRGGGGRAPVLAARGAAMFTAGLFKKVVIADNLAQFVTPLFAHVDAGGTLSPAWAWLAALGYAQQIYFDFSGYSDMALGLGLMFGIRLPVNFRSPYRATSIVDFWRRWHITLSRFLRDYLYIPLGGNRAGAGRRYLNLMLTMLLGGLWHGAGWTFVVWGALHGVYLTLNHVVRGAWRAALPRPLAWLATFAAVVAAWVVFRAETLAGAGRMLRSMVGHGDGASYVSPGVLRLLDLPMLVGADRLLSIGLAAVALAMLVAVALPNVPQIFGYREYRRAPEPSAALRWRPNAAWAFVAAAALTLSLFGMWQRLEFLYFQF